MNKFIIAVVSVLASSLSFASAFDSTIFTVDPASHCHACNNNETDKFMVCSGCKVARYCNRTCQVKAWPGHKMWCTHHNNLAVKQEISLEDLMRKYSRAEIEDEGLTIFAETFKATYGLFAGLLVKDTFHDQRASKSKLAAGLLYQSLVEMVNKSHGALRDVHGILMPGVGYLSSAEATAIRFAFSTDLIFGFDIDEKAIAATKLTNPDLASRMTVQDGLSLDTWALYSEYPIGLVLLVHPLFYQFSDNKKVINALGSTMISHLKATMPGVHVALIAKSTTELAALNDLLVSNDFEISEFIDNEARAFPCYSFGMNLIINHAEKKSMSPMYTDPVKDPFTSDIARNVKDVAAMHQDVMKVMRLRGEQRYRYLVLAKAPLHEAIRK